MYMENKGIYEKKIIYIDSEQIVKNSMLWVFVELGFDIERLSVKADIYSRSEELIGALMNGIKGKDIVITQNFIPSVAEACHRQNIIYISWVYDSPQIALYQKEAQYETNHIFMFDKAEIKNVLKYNSINIEYLPLASNITEASGIYISDDDIKKFSSQVSFVGSLYKKEYLLNGTVPEDIVKKLSEHIVEKIGSFPGRRNYQNIFDDDFYSELIPYINMTGTEGTGIDEKFLADQLFGVPYIANKERIEYINRAAAKYDTRLYTNEKEVSDIKANVFPPVNPENDMYRVFYSSKVNLNITHRGIISGVPQRVFDIMAVGGFVLSNYQSEIEELFEIGKEIEVFHDIKEFDEKLEYYLSNERERIQIGINGYLKAKELYNYRKATEYMLATAIG